jgi:clan AA aspartic protease (TIGR02281 family)
LLALLFFGAAQSHELPLLQHTSGNYYLNATLDGDITVEFLLDTGSGYVSLNQATFNRIKTHQAINHVRDIHGTMANGSVLKVHVYTAKSLTLGEGCVLTDIEFVVLPNSQNILGLSALRRLSPLTISFDSNRLVFEGCRGG